MPFISYAQNHEDVVLWRTLGHLGQGFYIDIGAADPVAESVTKAFYDAGWHGINVEPLESCQCRLQAERPRDINLAVVVTERSGAARFTELPGTGLSTLDAGQAQRIVAERGLRAVEREVAATTLAELCEQHVRGPIHFLKIDVEGAERAVLAGADFRRWRPWIVLVEAVDALTREPTHAQWEALLLEHDYRFVLFDGVNRYYLAAEHAALAARLAVPANFLDDYLPWHAVGLQAEIDRHRGAVEYWQGEADREHRHAAWLESELGRLQAEIDRLRIAADVHALPAVREHAALLTHRGAVDALQLRVLDAEVRRQATENALGVLRQSRSWRLTAPLRAAQAWLSRSGGGANEFPSATDVPPVPLQGLEPSSVETPATVSAPPVAPAARPPLVPRWRIVGHIEGHYSLAVVNRALALALDAAHPGRVGFQPWHGQPYPPDAELSDLPAGQAAALRLLVDRHRTRAADARALPSAEAPLVSIVHHYPFITDPAPADLRLALFFWEESSVPAAAVDHLQRHFDAVLVATRFVRDALRNSGCALPIAIVPPGIDHLVQPDFPVQPAIALQPEQCFRILHLSSAFPRKGVDILLQAYFEAFSAADPVELYIKTFPNPHNTVRAQLAELRAARPDAPHVIVDEAALDDDTLVHLYRSAHVVALPTRGEGFNLPAAEAMALGIPLIVTGHGGHTDFCTPDTADLLPYTAARAASHLNDADACWAEPDAGELARRLWQHFAAVRDRGPQMALIDARRRTAAHQVRTRHTWANAVATLDNFVAGRLAAAGQGAAALAASPLRLAVLSTWATPCGIAEYTRGLLGSFDAAAAPRRFDLRIHCESRTAADFTQTLYDPDWRIGDEASVLAALSRIESESPDIVLVQHQPSLFSLRHAIPLRLQHLHAEGVVVVLELHSTRPLLAQHRPTDEALAALRRLDRIVVHNLEDRDNLLALDLCDNVALIPLGAVQPPAAVDAPDARLAERARLGIPANALVLASFGFLLPHKGVDTLIDALAPLEQAVGRPVHLLAANAQLDERSGALLAALRAQTEAAGVAGRVHWSTGFQPIEACIRSLAAADYIVLPYRHTHESASAAVTTAVAALRPVLVSPQPIFDDLAACTHRMAGAAAADIVAAVVRLEADPDGVAALVERQHRWLAARSWQVLSPRVAGLLAGLAADRGARPPAPRPPQLFVDVSVIYRNDRNTGIQRVVRSVLSAMLAAPPQGWQVRPVYAEADAVYRHTRRFHPAPLPPALPAEGALVQVRAGDVFLGLDLTAHLFPQHEGQLAWWRSQGVRIHYVVYDLIPLLHPQWVVPGIPEAFDVWIGALARQAHGLHCISAAVAEDVREWLQGQPPQRSDPLVITHFPLGADLENGRPTQGLPEDHVALMQRFGQAPVCLMVGTVEPRKGYEQALDAFERLWAQGDPRQLVIVGKPGWHTEALQARLRHHAAAGRRLHWIADASDEYLCRLYRRADLLLAASRAEGYGLPLVEAAHHGVPVLARDIAVFREIAPPGTCFFTAATAAELAEALRAWRRPPAEAGGGSPHHAERPTWAASAQALLGEIV